MTEAMGERRWLEAHFERYRQAIFGADISKLSPLRKLGALNFWVDSRAYNVVEMTHQIWLLAVCDLIIGSAEYSAS